MKSNVFEELDCLISYGRTPKPIGGMLDALILLIVFHVLYMDMILCL